ncbi:MAG: flexitail domain-containing putative surface protein [Dehalococcoidia bacterium]
MTSDSLGFQHRASAVLLVLIGLLTLGLLLSGTVAGAGPGSVNGTVSKIKIVYNGPCNPGQLASGFSITQSQLINPSSTKLVKLESSGDVEGCLGTRASPGTIIISGNEIFDYSAVAVRTTASIIAGSSPNQSVDFDLSVGNMTGQPDFPTNFPASGQIYVGEELMHYDSHSSASPFTFHIDIRGQNGIFPAHPSGEVVRAQGYLMLVDRNQPRYLGETPNSAAPHNAGDTVGSVKTYLICRGRLYQTGSNVTSRSRCYGLFEPAYSGGPNDPFWPDNPPSSRYHTASGAKILGLLPGLFHDISTGTYSSGNLHLDTDFLGYTCFPFIEDHLWVKVTTDISLDKTSMNEDRGAFRMGIFRNEACTTAAQIDPLGSQVDPFGSGAGVNISSTEISTTFDSDGDGCSDFDELASLGPGVPEAANGPGKQGYGRDPFSPYDLYDTDGDKIVTLQSDIVPVIGRFLTPTVNPNPDTGLSYGVQYDRGPTITGSPAHWHKRPPDNVISLQDDILGVILQFGHNCT